MTGRTSASFDSEAGYRQAIDTVIAAAATEIRVFDPDLVRPGLEQKTRNEALGRFLAAPTRGQVNIVLHDIDTLERFSPRLLSLLRIHPHIEIRVSPDELKHLPECFCLADGKQGAIRFHARHARGKLVLDDQDEIHPWWQRFESLWALSTPWRPTKAGL